MASTPAPTDTFPRFIVRAEVYVLPARCVLAHLRVRLPMTMLMTLS
jgi:hypothetical protein